MGIVSFHLGVWSEEAAQQCLGRDAAVRGVFRCVKLRWGAGEHSQDSKRRTSGGPFLMWHAYGV